MHEAGVHEELAHPHVLRHSFGLFMKRRRGELSRLQKLMGHASPDTPPSMSTMTTLSSSAR